MTRARALKQVIRARAAKTGERYTTARRHVLRALQLTAPVKGRPGGREPKPAPKAVPVVPKGGLSDAKTREKTGRGLDHWFEVLDKFGAVEKGHTAAARHLYEDHKVDGWYSQGITVAYERARGVRAVNQRYDGVYEVSASKVVSATTADVVKAFTDTRRRRRWIGGADADLGRALAKGIADKTSKGFVVRPDGLGRFRYKWDGAVVQLYLIPKAGGKLTVSVQHTRLPGADSVERFRGQWRAALASLAGYFKA